MKRGEVFVRAQDPNGRWGTSDVLDLDLTSRCLFILDRMVACKVVVAMREPEGDSIPLRRMTPYSEED